MDPAVVKLGIMALAAAISGFFLVGFIVYSIYAVIDWLSKKKHKEKMWGGLTGVVINGIIFLLTFPTVFPIIRESVTKLISRFM